MALTLYPHCDYVSDTISTIGPLIAIERVDYTTVEAIDEYIGSSGTGNIAHAIDYLNENLQSYGLFSTDGTTISVSLSENYIESMEYSRRGTTTHIPFTQVGGSCVDLPLYGQVIGVQGNSITADSIHEWAVIELLMLAVVTAILTMVIIFKKL